MVCSSAANALPALRQNPAINPGQNLDFLIVFTTYDFTLYYLIFNFKTDAAETWYDVSVVQ